mmetsp:Transcript_2864/g.11496  ORF Transcript_2864/g.11496 Transcript_2864/m.11496 type:complete len:235 (+) Transcript_2864:395-1099(+)
MQCRGPGAYVHSASSIKTSPPFEFVLAGSGASGVATTIQLISPPSSLFAKMSKCPRVVKKATRSLPKATGVELVRPNPAPRPARSCSEPWLFHAQRALPPVDWACPSARAGSCAFLSSQTLPLLPTANTESPPSITPPGALMSGSGRLSDAPGWPKWSHAHARLSPSHRTDTRAPASVRRNSSPSARVAIGRETAPGSKLSTTPSGGGGRAVHRLSTRLTANRRPYSSTTKALF